MIRTLKQARAAISHLNPDAVRKRASRPVRVGLIASSAAGYERMERTLIPPETPAAERASALVGIFRGGDPKAPKDVDVVLYEQGIPVPKGAYVLFPGDPRETLDRILSDDEELDLPLARQYPGFRKPVVERVIHSIARENTLFAIATALPDVIPNLVELPWVFGEWASDTAFITANQIRMAYLIAAACGKNPGLGNQKGQVLTIGASAFGWRAIARELAGKIPLGGGLIAKGAISYAGTILVGKGLELLHTANATYTGQEKKNIYQQALERGKAAAQSLIARKS
jgi:hypothetical protein